ncbi:NAD(P)/FAD-dependent oxidoreductase [uncultured Methylobacterium sp.]|uniref:NAD(P)/FAD-dependent oxidoreductase n=1 Tax=uncultured Methylobacterium sp. TaxID=157278 RepID=UPI0035CAF1F3
MSQSGIVILGAGQAGFQVAASLREGGFVDPVTLIGDEPGLPYQRPPLSKAYLAGKVEATGLALRAPAYFEDHGIVHRGGVRGVAIDREARVLHLDDGTSFAYEHLVLATGSRNRTLPMAGAELAGVHHLRSLADADCLQADLAGAESVVIVGAGFIGLEFASVCAARGLAVGVVEAGERPMARAVSAQTASYFTQSHEAAGVRFAFGAGIRDLVAEAGRIAGVVIADGTALKADLLLIGIGVVPNQEIAADAGLEVADGIVVDAHLATGDPAISAIGDAARFPSRFASGLPGGDRVRIESVQNAVDQGRCLAARLVGRPAPYDAVPWFWSDQGPHKLQIAGLSSPSDEAVVRQSGNGLSVFRYRDGRLSAVESIDRAADHMAARRILTLGLPVTPEQAADPGFDLKALAKGV